MERLAAKSVPVVMLAGPTGSGKSSLALELARSIGGEIVNADASQCYAELPILSATPDKAAHETVPHHLYGCWQASDGVVGAARWAEAALPVIMDIAARKRVAIVTGGSGFYLKALCDGLSDIPDPPPAIRFAVRDRLRAFGPEKAHEFLTRHDPESAATIRPSDSQRLARAIEILQTTGKGISWWHRHFPPVPPGGDCLSFFQILLMPVIRHDQGEDFQKLLAHRFRAMIDAGAQEEADFIGSLNLPPTHPLLKAIGVRELLSVARGETDLEDAIDQAVYASRRYAKRQATWFNRYYKADMTLSSPMSETELPGLIKAIDSFLFSYQITKQETGLLTGDT